MVYNQHTYLRRGFTLIELMMVSVIVSIIAFSGGFLLTHFMQNSIFISNQLNTEMLIADALDIMIEGDSQAKGLRFSRAITTAQDDQVVFVNQDNLAIRYRLNTLNGQLYRSISGGPEHVIPYYATTAMTLSGKSGKVFSYYNAAETATAVASQVRRISLTLNGKSGTGSFDDWEGQSEQTSSIAVPKFQ